MHVNARAKFFAVYIGSLICKLYNGFCEVNSELNYDASSLLILVYSTNKI